MDDQIKILGIAGSIREGSYNRMLLKFAKSSANQSLASMNIYDIEKLPLYNQDMEQNLPNSVKEFKQAVAESDAILMVTPEYNYSISGVLKNAIDWASRPFGDNSWAGKPVAIMGASTSGFGTLRAQLHLRQIFLYLNMHPVAEPEIYVSYADQRFNKSGELIDDDIRMKVKNLLDALIIKTRSIKGLSW